MKQNGTLSKVSVSYFWFTPSKLNHEIQPLILRIIVNQFFMNENNCNKEVGITVTGFTEFTWNKITYRANPCYKQDIAWFDWVLVAWTIPSGTNCDIIGPS